MKCILSFWVVFILSAFASLSLHAQDPATASPQPQKSSLKKGETTEIIMDVQNSSAIAWPASNLVTWQLNIPGGLEFTGNYRWLDPLTDDQAFDVTFSPYGGADDGQFVRVVTKNTFANNAAFANRIYLEVIGRIDGVYTNGLLAYASTPDQSYNRVLTNDAGSSSITVAGVLPVIFGAINASIDGNNNLAVNWSTEQEKNNDHFEVIVSADGKKFVKAGEVKSLAQDGNSDKKIDYMFHTDFSSLQLGMGLLIILVAGISYRQRNRWWQMAFLFCVLATGLLLACKKKEEEIPVEGKDLFVRIIQVDIDNSSDTSKVVKVQNK